MFADFLARTIDLNNLSGCRYFEPFAGGAGAALRLLLEGVVSELYLNDIDPRITVFWKAVFNESERFAEAILTVPVSTTEWYRQREICRHPEVSEPFEIGFAAFYLNRCNRSGVITGAAPIGGYAQKGQWKIGARFYREQLAQRVLILGRRREQIHITEMDARDFLVRCLPYGHARQDVFVYLDPPYHLNGNRLYVNFYNDQDHKEISRYIQRQRSLNWIMSYDDRDLIRELYATCRISQVSLQYSLQRKQRAKELMIAPHYVCLPSEVGSAGDKRMQVVSA